jgi:hypothetical protein
MRAIGPRLNVLQIDLKSAQSLNASDDTSNNQVETMAISRHGFATGLAII